jgi:spermidine synthase
VSKRASKSRREPAEPPITPIETEVVQRALPEASARSLPWLLLLLAGSGCAALIYEIVWFQLLQLVIGSSAVSLGLLLAAYMGGLCLGSALFPRFVSSRQHPLRVYAFLELGIGAFGMIALFGVPLIGRLYVAGATSGLLGLVLRGMVATVCLLPPTLLMGGSLPAITRWVQSTPKGISWMGWLYSANVAGAVFGCVLAGFYLLRVSDMAVTTYTAAAVNGAVALFALALATCRTYRPPGESEAPAESAPRASGAIFIYVAIALSGLTALGAEVVWTRLLSLLLGATVYTFSIILAVFLIGLWAGSTAGSWLAARIADARLALAACQVLLAAGIAWTAFTLAYSLPYWPVDPWLSISPLFNFDLDMTRCLRTILPATLLWGASFPLALAAAARRGEDPALLTGEVYAANTAGSIIGALVFSLLLIPTIGTRASEQWLIWLAAASAAGAMAPSILELRAKLPRAALRYIAMLAGTLVLAGGLAWTVAEVPWQAIAYGRRITPILRGLVLSAEAKPLFVGEGINASVVITSRGDQRFFYVSGKSEASTTLLDMRLQRMMGNLPALVHPAPRSVLVVGFGAGVTAGSFVPYPEVQNITICELEPIIPPASDEFFGKENYHVLRDGRTHIVYDDARHYILTVPYKFDIITTDPIHPWVKGTSTLYSKEYYELVKQHLKPGGVVAQWLPLYESNLETVKTELATFFDVFPNGTVWSNYLSGDGYDMVLLGSPDGHPINLNDLQRRLQQPSYAGVVASLAEARFNSAVDLLATYAGQASDLKPMLADADLNDDLNLRLQYLAGLGLNSVMAPQIYREILSYRKFPETVLTGAGEPFAELQESIGRRHRTF